MTRKLIWSACCFGSVLNCCPPVAKASTSVFLTSGRDPQFSCESDYARVVISDAVVKQSVFWFKITSILLYEGFFFPLEMVRPKLGGMLRFRRSPSRVRMQHCRVIHALWFDSGR